MVEQDQLNEEQGLLELLSDHCAHHGLHFQVGITLHPDARGFVGAVWGKNEELNGKHMARRANGSVLFPSKIVTLRAMLARTMDYIARKN